jgi:hypothetical protein
MQMVFPYILFRSIFLDTSVVLTRPKSKSLDTSQLWSESSRIPQKENLKSMTKIAFGITTQGKLFLALLFPGEGKLW